MSKEKTLEKIRTEGNMQQDNSLSKYMSEMDKIRRKGRVDSNKIKVHEFADHKNISLWTPEGKRVGPMHRTNAERAFKLFWEIGVRLQVDQPTAEEIEAYKQTDEYKQKLAEHLKTREHKEKSRSKKSMDRIVKAIAEMSGQTVEAITNIAKPNEVISTTESLKKGKKK